MESCRDRKITVRTHGRFRGDWVPYTFHSAARIMALQRVARTRSVRSVDMDRGGVDAFCACQESQTRADGIA